MNDERIRDFVTDDRTPVDALIVPWLILPEDSPGRIAMREVLFGADGDCEARRVRTDLSDGELRTAVYECAVQNPDVRQAMEDALGKILEKMGPEKIADLMVTSKNGGAKPEYFDEMMRHAVTSLVAGK